MQTRGAYRKLPLQTSGPYKQERPITVKGPYIKVPLQTRGPQGQRAHTDKGPPKTRAPNRRCAINTDEGTLRTRGPTDKEPLQNKGPIQTRDFYMIYRQLRGPHRQRVPYKQGGNISINHGNYCSHRFQEN